MDLSGSVRIDTEAAIALAEWKAFFAEQVAMKARELAQSSPQPSLITIAHYRQAAVLAAQALATEVEKVSAGNDSQDAA